MLPFCLPIALIVPISWGAWLGPEGAAWPLALIDSLLDRSPRPTPAPASRISCCCCCVNPDASHSFVFAEEQSSVARSQLGAICLAAAIVKGSRLGAQPALNHCRELPTGWPGGWHLAAHGRARAGSPAAGLGAWRSHLACSPDAQAVVSLSASPVLLVTVGCVPRGPLCPRRCGCGWSWLPGKQVAVLGLALTPAEVLGYSHRAGAGSAPAAALVLTLNCLGLLVLRRHVPWAPPCPVATAVCSRHRSARTPPATWAQGDGFAFKMPGPLGSSCLWPALCC